MAPTQKPAGQKSVATKTGKPTSEEKKEPERLNYGEKVKRRRIAAADALEDPTLSKSKKRKIILEQEKSVRKPHLNFEKEVGRRHSNLLNAMKRREDQAAKCEELMDALIPKESGGSVDNPIQEKLNALRLDPTSAEAQQAVLAYMTKPIVSRSLQACLKVGKPEQRQSIFNFVKPLFHLLATYNAAGSHLCMKLVTYGDKQTVTVITGLLCDNPKSFFNQFGANVWDHVLRKCSGIARVRHRFMMKLFFEKIAVATELDQKKLHETSPVQVLAALNENLKRVFKMRMQEFLDKLVLKELLGSEIVQHFLCFLVKNDEFFTTEDVTGYAEATFEGAQALMNAKEGIYALCRLMGHWSAKQRKQFLTNVAATQKLRNQSWTDYFCNDLVAVAIGRLLVTVDDTKSLASSILCPAFNVKITKVGILKGSDKASAERILQNLRAVAVILNAMTVEHSNKFLPPYDREQLDYASVTSKKDPEIRRREIATWMGQILTTLQLSRNPDDYSQTNDNAALKKKHRDCLQAFFATVEALASNVETAEAEAESMVEKPSQTNSEEDEKEDKSGSSEESESSEDEGIDEKAGDDDSDETGDTSEDEGAEEKTIEVGVGCDSDDSDDSDEGGSSD